MDNFDLNLADFDSDYLVAVVVVVDCNNHSLIDLVGKQVDFVVDIAKQQHYFSEMTMAAAAVVVAVLVLVRIPPLLGQNILPKETDVKRKIT